MTRTAPLRSAEQEQFAQALHDMLAGADTPQAARQWADGEPDAGLALWRKLAGLGVTALAVPPACGGLGADLTDLVVACEELGHHALPGPVAESLAAVPLLLAALREAGRCVDPAAREQCGRWLAALADGRLTATLAVPPRLPCALDTHVADLVLLAKEDTVRLATPAAGHLSVDRARRLCEALGGQVIAQGPAVRAAASRAFGAGVLASAAQLLGAGQALLAASLARARQREQFGRPIGAFQAVKHQLADVVVGLEFARPLLWDAAQAMSDHRATAPRDVSAARVACADAAYRAARTALQVHGAIGYTAEHDVSLWLTKVTALRSAWGTQSEHRAAVMAALTGDGEPSWA